MTATDLREYTQTYIYIYISQVTYTRKCFIPFWQKYEGRLDLQTSIIINKLLIDYS